jgi:peptidoglycan/xylan/chitin deacetylase (PgdA/CDA1 family)
LTIIGTGFDSGTVVNGFSSVLTPTSFTSTKLVVTVPPSEFAAVKTVQVMASNTNGQSNASVFNVINQGFVSINFDDGYQSTYANGLPILDQAGMSYTWYIITHKPQPAVSYFATWLEILSQAAKPNVEIGNHTQTHAGITQPDGTIKFLTLLGNTPTVITNGDGWSVPIATTLPDETSGAQQDLQFMGLAPTTFAYPYGDYDVTPSGQQTLPFSQQPVELAVQTAGDVGARTTNFCDNVANMPMGQPPACGYVSITGTNPYALQAFEVNQNNIPTTLAELQYWTQPALPGHFDPTRVWTIITFHQVDETDVDSVDHTLLQSMVDYFSAQNIPVVTTSEGLVILNLNGQNR